MCEWESNRYYIERTKSPHICFYFPFKKHYENDKNNFYRMLAETEDGPITNILRLFLLLRLFLVSIFMRYFLQTLFTGPAEYLFYSKVIQNLFYSDVRNFNVIIQISNFKYP